MKKIIFPVTIFFALSCSFALDTTGTANKWKYSVLTNLTLTLNSYSDNWDGSEFSAMSWGWQFNGTAEKQFTKWISDKNTLKLAFGQTTLQEKKANGEKEWQKFKKSSDLIDFESVLRFTFPSLINPFIGARAITQFADTRVSGYYCEGNPLTITESFGALYDIMKRDKVMWSARLGGAVRQLIDRNELLPDSIKPLDKVVNDGGLELVTDFKAAARDNRISYISQIKVYEALFSSKEDKVKNTPAEDYWRYPDVSWENTVGVVLTKYIMLNVYAQLLYDREIDRDVRYRETVGLSLTYSIAN